MTSINITPIGVIYSPYTTSKEIPGQGYLREEVEAEIEIKDEYVNAMKDLDSFSHLVVLFYFHKSDKTILVGHPSWENEDHGVFALRSPHRPNHIGMTIVKVLKIKENLITFTNVDMLDGTPVIDIKPYVGEFERIKNPKFGWLEKHRINKNI
ncbi:MAG TPA: tRNA (N6-threonylcarbamoyladenosine(37)-N6)-methyltransferase TrmO [Candidatus Cloacimonetes bacterium]|nr:tRNA (N6-threonylcarbamoyladenosine(37)-N6)-methyltransferase TrmO [Candidatus Cloacimonadota bacterium]HEX37802.1 tRNA (N6-threonylcarbamoyladenosine(37)-N6)-methyltransferase TrmO [Candidatus Cloacimonadota bacterium]